MSTDYVGFRAGLSAVSRTLPVLISVPAFVFPQSGAVLS
jgi:hypothetical protein